MTFQKFIVLISLYALGIALFVYLFNCVFGDNGGNDDNEDG